MDMIQKLKDAKAVLTKRAEERKKAEWELEQAKKVLLDKHGCSTVAEAEEALGKLRETIAELEAKSQSLVEEGEAVLKEMESPDAE